MYEDTYEKIKFNITKEERKRGTIQKPTISNHYCEQIFEGSLVHPIFEPTHVFKWLLLSQNNYLMQPKCITARKLAITRFAHSVAAILIRDHNRDLSARLIIRNQRA